MNDSVCTHLVPHRMALSPPLAIAEPAYPPISACDELDGIPYAHVMMFQMIAPSSAPRITFGSTMLCSIMPAPTALATATPPVNSAAKLNVAAQITAARGLST